MNFRVFKSQTMYLNITQIYNQDFEQRCIKSIAAFQTYHSTYEMAGSEFQFNLIHKFVLVAYPLVPLYCNPFFILDIRFSGSLRKRFFTYLDATKWFWNEEVTRKKVWVFGYPLQGLFTHFAVE